MGENKDLSTGEGSNPSTSKKDTFALKLSKQLDTSLHAVRGFRVTIQKEHDSDEMPGVENTYFTDVGS